MLPRPAGITSEPITLALTLAEKEKKKKRNTSIRKHRHSGNTAWVAYIGNTIFKRSFYWLTFAVAGSAPKRFAEKPTSSMRSSDVDDDYDALSVFERDPATLLSTFS